MLKFVAMPTDVRGELSVDSNANINGAILPHRYVLVSKTADQQITHALEAPLSWNAAVSSGLTFATPGTDFVAPQSGIYSFTAQVIFGDAPAVGSRSVIFDVNGVPIINVNNAPFDSPGSAAGASAVWYLNAGDIVRCLVKTRIKDVPLLHARKHKRACNFRARDAKRRELLLDYPQPSSTTIIHHGNNTNAKAPTAVTDCTLSCDPVPRRDYERQSDIAYSCVGCGLPVCSATMIVLPNGAYDALYLHSECEEQRRALTSESAYKSLLKQLPFQVN